MIKLLLCILIIFAGFASGQLKAKTYDNRVMHLDDFVTTLKILQSEMMYRLDPLPELFLRISGLTGSFAGTFFGKVNSLLKTEQYRDFTRCWNEAVESIYKDSSLTGKDKQVIRDFGLELGKTDIGSQHSLFARTYALLEVQIAEAVEEKKTKGKMYKSLGTSIGVLIVIVLI